MVDTRNEAEKSHVTDWPIHIPWPGIAVSSPVPDVSIVIPCYNEEHCLGTTIPPLVQAFQNVGIGLELVVVDNGSTDQTGTIIDDLALRGLPIRKLTLERNQGYGVGILRGFELCRSRVVGFTHADGQVAPEDVVTAYRLMEGREDRVLAKVRRRFRQDSMKRKVVSIIYNGLMQVVFGWLGVIDINGSPKFLSRNNLIAMRLVSHDWFLDPEIVLKAKSLGLRAIEIDVEGHSRNGGISHVRPSAIVEFIKNILRYRIGGYYRTWKRSLSEASAVQAKFGTRTLCNQKTVPNPKVSPPSYKPESINLWDAVRVIEERRFEDSRGFLHKILSASQCRGNVPRGEVYVTAASPSTAKGNHFHRKMGEFFAIVQGDASVELCDPSTGEQRSIHLCSTKPATVYVPAGLAHAVVNRGECMMICVAWAEREHDPDDVFSYIVWPSVDRAQLAHQGGVDAA